MILFSSRGFKKNKFHHSESWSNWLYFQHGANHQSEFSPPHWVSVFYWFHRGWRVLLQLPALGLGELDVTPLVGNGTELSELFDLSLGCGTFMKTPWFRWWERKAVRFNGWRWYEIRTPSEQGGKMELSTGECQCWLQTKDCLWWRLGLQFHKWNSEYVEKWALQPSSFVTQHIGNGEKNSNNDSFGDVGLPNLYLGTTPHPVILVGNPYKPSMGILDSCLVGRPNLYPKRTQFSQKELSMEPRICLIRGDFVLVNVSLALQSPAKKS